MEEPAESLRCDRIELRRWRMTDLDGLERTIHESLDHLVPWMPWAADPSRQHISDFLARNLDEWRTGQAFGYAITSDASLIGSCSLMRRIGPGGLEIGYWLHPRWTGRGLATTAAAALIHQGFHLTGIDRIEIHHDAANSASAGVARRLGFTEVERKPLPEGPLAPAETGVNVIWRMTAAQWRARTAIQHAQQAD
ncbi:GNAT family N-acetyltransferase [Streptomyces formicae]|uniref:GNAT family N-acetyltransferase n=1 Tax=Streptomyces formicae TaxID=1616117 RepID=A0ABY3WR26_9ACTN|nr:GNAT family N-acetyltransferase [Streptomyces formicae]UNM13257.1 GNAT family N-acetyltransferase [Streptomyces formicae]